MEESSGDRLTEDIERGLDRARAPSGPGIAERLAELARLLCRWGRQINLSGHRTPEAVAENLVLDAAALSRALPPFDSVADLGSGAGFPGLPIAILYPEVEVYLVEARLRRHHFQRAAVRELAIGNAHPLHGRIEQLEPRPCSIAIAQAVGPAASVLTAIRPWARVGGWLAIPASWESAAPSSDSGSGAPSGSTAPPFTGLEEVNYQVPGGRRRKVWVLPS